MEELMKLTKPTVKKILNEENTKLIKSKQLKDFIRKHKGNEMLEEMLSSLVFIINLASENPNADELLIFKDVMTIYTKDLTE